MKIFARSPYYESRINDNGTISITSVDLPLGMFVEADLLFPIDYVPNMSFTSNEKKLESILAEEKKLTEESDAIHGEDSAYLKIIKNIISFDWTAFKSNVIPLFIKGYITSFAVFIILAIFFSAKAKRKYYTDHFEGEYYRELPADYSPAEMSMLANNGNISINDITATLLDLFRRKIILIESVKAKTNPYHLFENDDHKITKLKDFENDPSVNEHEKFLLKFLLSDIGNSEYVYLSEIKTFARLHCSEFKAKYSSWKFILFDMANKRGFSRKIKLKFSIGWVIWSVFFMFVVVSIFILKILKCIGSDLTNFFVISSFMCTFVCFAFLISPLCTIRHDKSKHIEYEKWQAFKRYLKNFSNLGSASVIPIAMWEHYLVYAVSLGVGKRVIEQLPLVFKSYDLKNNKALVLLSYAYSDNFNGHRLDAFCKQLHKAVATAIYRERRRS